MNDRRREAQQRLAARAAFEKAKKEELQLDRYVRSVLRSRAGEMVRSHDGRLYQVQGDGSLRRVEGGMS